jgi:hypothetical protein
MLKASLLVVDATLQHCRYAPLKDLLEACSSLSKKRTGLAHLEYQEALVDLLQLVCSLVQKQPFFAELFLETAPKKQFVLLSTTMSLVEVGSLKVARKVRECLKICLCLPSASVATTITEEGAACNEIARRLLQLYAEMPHEFEDDEIVMHGARFSAGIYARGCH